MHKQHTRSRPSVFALARLVLAMLLLIYGFLHAPFVLGAENGQPTLLVNTESFDQIDDGDGTSDRELRFGSSSTKLTYSVTNARFEFSSSIRVTGDVRATGTLSGAQLRITGTGAGVAPLISTDLKFGTILLGTGAAKSGTGASFAQLHIASRLPSRITGTLGGFAGSPTELQIQGRYGYTIESNTLKTIDFTNPNAPTVASTLAIAGGATYVKIAGHYAYVIQNQNTLNVIDISNPASPIRVGSGSTTASRTRIAIQGRYAYLSGGDYIDVMDIGNPARPVRVSTLYSADTSFGEMDIQGDYLYVSAKYSSRIVNIRDPANISIVGTASNPGLYMAGIAVQGRTAYVAGFDNAVLQIFDAFDPASPVVRVNFALGTMIYDVAVQGNIAYVVDNTLNTLYAIDVSNPVRPVRVGSLSIGGSVGYITIVGRYAYLTGSQVIYVVDLGGAYLQQVEAGGIEATSISVRSNLTTLNANIVGGLNVGRGVQSQGPSTFTNTSMSASGSAAVSIISNTGALQIGARGTSAAPHISFGTGLTFDTRLWRSAANVLRTNATINTTGLSSSGNVLIEGGATLSGSIIRGFGLNSDCDGDGQTVSWDATSGQFGCGDDDQGGGAAGLVDHYVRASGDTMTGTLIVQNGTVHTPTGAALINVLGTISGAQLRVSGPTDIHGALSASGAIRTDSGAILNADLTAADTSLTFGHATANGTILYGNAFTEFTFNRGIRVNGNISGSGNLLLEYGGLLSGSILRGFGLQTDCDDGTNSKVLWDATLGRFSCGTDQGGGGGGISYAQAEGMFVNQGGDTMTGTLVVNVSTTSDIVRSTSGSTAATDFAQAGSSFLNVISQDDSITIAEGGIPNGGLGTVSSSSTVTTANVGAGAYVIFRDDGQYLIFLGNASTTVNRWDGTTNTMSAMTATTTAVGAGALPLRRPDGRYLLIPGGASNTANVYDPYNITAQSNVTLTSCGGTTGTNAVLTASGNYIILCGGSGNWGIYNPTANTYRAGTALGASFGAGAHALQRDDGTFLVFAGGNSSNHWILNATRGMDTMWSSINPITASAPTVTTGGFSIRRTDGKFLVIPGAADSSYVYDPTRTPTASGGTMIQQSGAGFGPTSALGDGAQAIWRQDGKYLLLIGGGSTTTNIIDPGVSTSSQFTAGPALNGGPNAGALAFMRPDGQYQIIRGAAGTATETYDTDFVIGGPSTSTGSIFTTECISAPSTNTGSRLYWNSNSEDKITMQVRTGNGSCSGNYRVIPNNGDLIRPASGDNHVQVQVIFKRSIPRFADQEWNMRKGVSMTRYRRTNRDPTLFDFTIENSAGVHRTQFEFGDTGKASSPIAVNVVNEKDRKNELALARGVAWATTANTTNNYMRNGSFVTNPVTTTAINSPGTLVMKKPDGNFVFISGNKTTANAQLFDPNTKAFSALGTTPTVALSSGALAFKRPDGKFLIVAGGLNPLATNIFDPNTNSFTAGPNLTGAKGAGPGSHVIPLSNGRVLIIHGNFTRDTSVYDPRQNTMMMGPQPTRIVGLGAMAIPRPDGSWLEIPGATAACALNTVSNFFDPDEMVFNSAGAPAITTGVGPGATAFERSDGQWVIMRGGGTATTCAATTATLIYNPITNRVLAGPTLTTAIRYGSTVLPRPDGTWLITVGNGTTTTQIYFEKSGAFTAEGLAGVGTTAAGPALITAAGTGSLTFQTDDGKFIVPSGANAPASAGTTTMNLYDAGWVTSGYYASEIMQVSDLDSTSTLSWKALPDMKGVSAEVRTAATEQAIQTARAREVAVSGGRINPGAGETFVRAQFNFKRSFPSYGGIFSDVWYNGGSSMIIPWRQIPTPILQEFSINKDKDIISLRDANVPLFRVSTNGDIFTGNLGSVNTGGADLAERYTSPDELKAGELVSIDYGADHGVRRATTAYQDDVLGVVSTNPGFIAGAFTKGSYPVALVGRVPVNITNEGGPIKIGDRITSASLAGYGMKANEAGRVVGIAMDNLDLDRMQPCEKDKKRKCGTVMMFVNLSDYNGPKK